MLLPLPNSLTFGEIALSDAAVVTIDRAAAKAVLDWSDAGPHPVFADVPEQCTTITIARDLIRGDLSAPAPGQLGELAFLFSAAGANSDAARKRFTAACVVRDVRHELLPARPAARQLITFLPISPDGTQDPVTITDA